MSNTFSIELHSGRSIDLIALNQSLTYEWLIEGLPTTELNQRIIERALKKAILSHWDGKPCLIQPTETAIEYRQGEKYPFGNPAALPGVLCEGRFRSFQPARDESQDHSWLIIVWFQDEFALPIDQDVEKRIKALEWNSIANDDEY